MHIVASEGLHGNAIFPQDLLEDVFRIARRIMGRELPRSRAVCAVAYPFERRHVAGAVPKAFLKARENAASEP